MGLVARSFEVVARRIRAYGSDCTSLGGRAVIYRSHLVGCARCNHITEDWRLEHTVVLQGWRVEESLDRRR